MNDEVPTTTTTLISDEQMIVASVIGACSVSLSILGSVTIIFKILRARASNGFMTPYNRMMLGLSACDIIFSANVSIIQFLYPSGRHPWAFGNATTCQAAGFLIQLSSLSFWYNGLLSYFFLLTVLSKVRQKNYVQLFEPWLHLSAAYWPITAILGLFLGWFGEDSPTCHIAEERIGLIIWVVAIPNIFVYFSIIINYTAICFIVRKSLQSVEHVAGSESVPKRIKKETTTLMIFYIAGFLISVTPWSVMRYLMNYYGVSRDDSKVFPARIFAAITLPLQGFFNFLIYIKPVYARFRAAYPNKSRRFVLQQAILKSKAPPKQHRRVANHITQTSDVVITDVTLLPDSEMDPNEELFYPGAGQLSSVTDAPSNDIAEGNDQRRWNEAEDAREDESDHGSITENDHSGARTITTKTGDVEEQIISASDTNENHKEGANSQ